MSIFQPTMLGLTRSVSWNPWGFWNQPREMVVVSKACKGGVLATKTTESFYDSHHPNANLASWPMGNKPEKWHRLNQTHIPYWALLATLFKQFGENGNAIREVFSKFPLCMISFGWPWVCWIHPNLQRCNLASPKLGPISMEHHLAHEC